MAKSYYQNGNFIVPFACVTAIIPSTNTRCAVEIHTVAGKSYGVFEEQVKYLISTYTTWLDSQSNNIL